MTTTQTMVMTKDFQQSSQQAVLSFDGEKDYIYIGSGAIKSPQNPEKVLNLTQTMTIESWIKLDTYKDSFIFTKAMPGDQPLIS